MRNVINFRSKSVKEADKKRIVQLFDKGLIDLYERDKWLKSGGHL